MAQAPVTEHRDHAGSTRMLFMGDAALTDGFHLIGFETWADPSMEEVDRVLGELVSRRQNALVIMDGRLSRAGSPLVQRIRAEGGRIVITEVPPLNQPECFHCDIDDQVQALLGTSSLERTEG